MDDDVDVARVVVADNNGLQHAFDADAVDQFCQSLLVKCAPRLIGIGLDPVQADVARIRHLDRADRLWPRIGQEVVQIEATLTALR